MIYKCNQIASVYCIIFLLNIAATGATHAQSIAENTISLTQDLDAVKAEFISNLQQAASHPENLNSGQTKVNAEKILQKIDSIQFRINETSDLLSQKENALSAKTSLGESEKLELKQALQAQRKPLEACKQTATQLKNTTRSLLENKLNEIHEVYKNYLDIAGPEQAKAKLETNIQAILAQYLPPKPKSTPATPDSTSMPNLQSPLPESQFELEKVKAEKNRLLKIINDAQSPPPTPPPQQPKSKKNSLPVWRPKDKLPKEVRGHGLAGNFAIQGSSSDGSVIIVPAEDADNPFARQFWIINRSFAGGANALVPIGQREIIQVPSSRPLKFIGRGILPGIYNVEAP